MNIFQTTRRILFGSGTFRKIPGEVKFLGGSRVLIVTGPNIIRCGFVKHLEEMLKLEGIASFVFSEIETDPSFQTAEKAAEEARKVGADCIIGLGGGSNMDVAKAAAVMVTNTGPVKELFGVDRVRVAGIRLILVPTTAGTGSEVTHISILTDNEERIKAGIVSPYLLPDSAVLDPDLTMSVPPLVTAFTGMDALVHAVESFTSVRATALTDMYAVQAIKILYANLRRVYANGDNAEARSAMLYGSMLAGISFANAGVTATHAFAYPIGACHDIPHGIANTIMFPAVMEFNMTANLSKFAAVAGFFGENIASCSERKAAGKMIRSLRILIADLDLPTTLEEYGVKEEDIPDLAAGVMKVTRILANNPRKVTLKDAEAIYRKVLKKSEHRGR